MSNTKHTPGPWSHRDGRVFQTDWEALTIANVSRAHDGDYSPANGALIAAAPELLAVVNKLAAWNRAYPSSRVYGYGDIKKIAAEMDAINDEAVAAITKATGVGV